MEEAAADIERFDCDSWMNEVAALFVLGNDQQITGVLENH